MILTKTKWKVTDSDVKMDVCCTCKTCKTKCLRKKINTKIFWDLSKSCYNYWDGKTKPETKTNDTSKDSSEFNVFIIKEIR